ncbi:DUF2752 domain-containing protein [Gemmata sp.]|uniref:DUF2752 domain-containing protein n=1 Tax=Gemmata sp. TaxID=1914242 RepID=UPI003F6FEFAC
MVEPRVRVGRPHRWVRVALVALGLCALGGAGYLVAVTPPTADSLYPKCVLYQATGLHCPGCGTGRAAHAVLNGRLVGAAGFNPFATLAVPVLFVLAVRRAVLWVRGSDRLRARRSSRWGWGVLAVVVAFWVLRNVPAYPFTLLAPPGE